MFKRLLARYPLFFYEGIRRIRTPRKTVYLTFDDGPTSGVTEQILEILNRYSVKATFFCCGKNADENLELLRQIEASGHTIGYHSYSHKDILKTKSSDWLEDVEKQSSVLDKKLFRPPYGRVTPKHFRYLRSKYQFVFWDVMSYDYDKRQSCDEIIDRMHRSVRNGSVIVFHDNIKSSQTTLTVLPKFIDELIAQGYEFGLIPE